MQTQKMACISPKFYHSRAVWSHIESNKRHSDETLPLISSIWTEISNDWDHVL